MFYVPCEEQRRKCAENLAKSQVRVKAMQKAFGGEKRRKKRFSSLM